MENDTPRAAVEDWQQQKIDGLRLMRRLLSYRTWRLPVSEAAAQEMRATHTANRFLTHRDEKGVQRLYLFSGPEALQHFQRATGTNGAQHALTAPGTWLFQLPLEGIDLVVLDPASPWEVFYGREHLAHLAALSLAIEVEDALASLSTGQGDTEALLAKVRDYPRYLLGLEVTPKGTSLALAPDDQPRALAAVFTFEDDLEAYLAASQKARPGREIKAAVMRGPALFEKLRAVEALHGVAFHSCGPRRPVAFARGFFDLVLGSS